MSWTPTEDPQPGDARACDAIEHVIVPRARDLGGFSVRRALPSARKQMIGPFIFFDQMGPAEFLIGNGIDVRPHPHIGLATVTYLFDGEMWHRDSLGTRRGHQAGRGEPDDGRRRHRAFGAHRGRAARQRPRLFGIQAWAALPKTHEEARAGLRAPRAGDLPRISGEGKSVRLVMGERTGRSPVEFPACQLVRRGRAGAGRRAAARSRLRRAGGLRRLRRDRHRRRKIRRRAAAGVQAGRPHLDPRDIAVAPHAAGRRADGRTAPHLVEFRLVVEGPHRRRQGRLESEAFRLRARRREEFIPLPDDRPA